MHSAVQVTTASKGVTWTWQVASRAVRTAQQTLHLFAHSGVPYVKRNALNHIFRAISHNATFLNFR